MLWQPYDQRRNLISIIERHDVLRFVEGYALLPDLSSKADSFQQAIQALGPNIMSIRVDRFRSFFKSEDGWKNIFLPMDDALKRRKRKASEIDN